MLSASMSGSTCTLRVQVWAADGPVYQLNVFPLCILSNVSFANEVMNPSEPLRTLEWLP